MKDALLSNIVFSNGRSPGEISWFDFQFSRAKAELGTEYGMRFPEHNHNQESERANDSYQEVKQTIVCGKFPFTYDSRT